jgi:hypothetical protein
MNCSEFRDCLLAHAEGLLDNDSATQYAQHLAGCAACRREQAAFEFTHHQLTLRGQSAATVSLAAPVMRRIHEQSTQIQAASNSISPFARWFFGAGVAAAAAVAIVAVVTLSPQSKAQASDVMARGVMAVSQVNTVHLQGRMRTLPSDNFSLIMPKANLCVIEMWKETAGLKRWRIEKPGRVAATNGQSTALLIRPAGPAWKVDQPLETPFDTSWLHAVTDLEGMLANALKMARTNGWKMELSTARDSAGMACKVVTIDTPSGVRTGDYLENKFLGTAATRRLFSFDDQTGQLKALRIYLHQDGDYLLVFEVTQIDYNVALADELFTLELPPGVNWTDLPQRGTSQKIANNEKYAGLTAEQATRNFFEACGGENWNEVATYLPIPLNDRFKAAFGGLTLINVGEAFTSEANPNMKFVPYEIRLRDGNTRAHTLALKRPPTADRWLVDGGI